MFLDRVIDFGENLGDKVRVRSPKKLKNYNSGSLCMPSEKYMFLASILFFSHLRSVFLHHSIHFWEILGDKVKGRSPKNLEILIEVP